MLRHGHALSSFLVNSLCRSSCSASYSTAAKSTSRANAFARASSQNESRHRPARQTGGDRNEHRKLAPFVLAKRLRVLCEGGDVATAVTALKESPRDAQNVVVWNQMMQACMTAGKYTAAYDLFTDVSPAILFPRVSTFKHTRR